MKNVWGNLDAKFRELALRERIILAFSVFAALYFLLTTFWVSSAAVALEEAELLFEETKRKIEKHQQELELYRGLAKKDPNVKFRRELERLDEELEATDKKLTQLTDGFVSAEKLPSILADVIKARGDLGLVSLKTLPENKIRLDDEQQDSGESELDDTAMLDALTQTSKKQKYNIKPKNSDGVFMYRYGVELVFIGRFFDVLKFLHSMEQQPWRFYWESMDYEVLDHPTALVKLEVYTLSTQQGVLDG